MIAGAGEAGEIRQAIESEIYFAGGTAIFVAANSLEKIGWEFAGLEKFFEREMRVDARRNYGG